MLFPLLGAPCLQGLSPSPFMIISLTLLSSQCLLRLAWSSHWFLTWLTLLQSLGREESLEKGMTAHSGFLAWRIPRTKEPRGLQSTGSQRVRHDLATKRTHIFIVFPFSKVKARVRTISSPLGWSVRWQRFCFCSSIGSHNSIPCPAASNETTAVSKPFFSGLSTAWSVRSGLQA